MNDWGTAIHEAGHAVVFLETGVGVRTVWVDGDQGGCAPRGRGNAIGYLAGTAAEWRHDYPGQQPTGAVLRRYLKAADLRLAADCIGSDDGALLVAVWREARRVIDMEWDSVLRIAEALQRRGRLTGDQVVALWRGQRLAA